MSPTLRIAPILLGAALAACSNGSTDPNGTGTLRFQLATSGTGATSSPNAAAASITRGADVLEVTSVQLVARKIKLRRADGSCPTADLSDEGQGDEADSPECPNLKLGPLLLDPPLTDGAANSFTVDLPAGTYSELRLQIHKPSNHTSDAAFLAANPGFDGISIKVTGTFDSEPFTFTTNITSEVEIEFAHPVAVTTGGTTSLTMLLDVNSWFLWQGGLALVSPLALDQQTRTQIEQNIRASFRAFRDQDHDGGED